MATGQGRAPVAALDDMSLPTGGPDWLSQLREQAQLALSSSGLPDKGWEHWRHNNLAAFAGRQLQAPLSPGDAAKGIAVLDELLPVDSGPRLVFVDGQLDWCLSDLDLLPEGITLSSLSGGLQATDIEDWSHRLSSSVDLQANPIVALNTALLRDALFVHVKPQVKPDRPLLVASYSTAQADSSICYPRLLVEVAEGAELQLIEWHGGADGVDYTSTPVSEFFVAANGSAEVARISEEGDNGHQLGAVTADVAAAAEVSFHSYVQGGDQVRVEMAAALRGEGGDASLTGFHLSDKRRFVEHHSSVRHCCEQTRSRQFFKGVLAGRSESLFDGMVHVDPGAQKTDAEQQNRNLLLSPLALAHSVPRLEIYADDVRCSHGATAGELDEQAIFYMRARGIDEQTAKSLLIRAFAAQAIDYCPVSLAAEYELKRLDDFLSLVAGEHG
ncbi:iron-sulfur cluster assembly protein SufD [Halorhodospira halochloris]|uniref:Iron-sulfur cluster assembly protein SufD n=1 Tax=Halorhodospira halochloris TaxID=1052 RepID=A0A0X8X7Z0_HALHR|nr:Fe-S cluster assembly protein SufD [Halorhodospira halochloris]MBK1651469.1 Fe-S cluster assembly protein SufD [Halorhodospira halochloris]BAU57270.1 iron-sulfur cluster assembly protein SufD [Halorhodospira halochloris]